jgi:hypothetical protein
VGHATDHFGLGVVARSIYHQRLDDALCATAFNIAFSPRNVTVNFQQSVPRKY